MHTAEIDLAVGYTLRRLTLRWDAHRGDHLRGVLHTAEIFLNLELLSPQWDAHRGDCLCGVMCTAEIVSARQELQI